MSRSVSLVIGLATIAWLLGGSRVHAAQLIGADSIGPDSTATDNLGGFAAMQVGIDTLGQPAVEISQDGSSLLNSMRVIVHGVEGLSTGALAFTFFDYKLKVWTKADYLAGLGPGIVADLGEPIGITLVQQNSNTIVPSEVFGEASYDPESYSLPSYDFRFDLTAATLESVGSGPLAIDEPLPAGDYIVAFQSHHNAQNGGLYVSLSNMGQGLTPYYYQNTGGMNEHPRGILFGQPPPYQYRWGWNIFESPLLPGDFDFDDDVDGEDFLEGQRGYGALYDDLDLADWEAHYGAQPLAATTAVPEPTSLALAVLAGLALTARRRSS